MNARAIDTNNKPNPSEISPDIIDLREAKPAPEMMVLPSKLRKALAGQVKLEPADFKHEASRVKQKVEPEVVGFSSPNHKERDSVGFGEYGLINELSEPIQPTKLSLRKRLGKRLQNIARKVHSGNQDLKSTPEARRLLKNRLAVGAVALAVSGGIIAFEDARVPTTIEQAEISNQLEVAPVSAGFAANKQISNDHAEEVAVWASSVPGTKFLSGVKAVEDVSGLKPGQAGFDAAFEQATKFAYTIDQQHEVTHSVDHR